MTSLHLDSDGCVKHRACIVGRASRQQVGAAACSGAEVRTAGTAALLSRQSRHGQRRGPSSAINCVCIRSIHQLIHPAATGRTRKAASATCLKQGAHSGTFGTKSIVQAKPIADPSALGCLLEFLRAGHACGQEASFAGPAGRDATSRGMQRSSVRRCVRAACGPDSLWRSATAAAAGEFASGSTRPG